MTKIKSLDRLLRPATLAVVGGELAAEVIRQSDHIGYQGQIWPVNPGRTTMEGRPCFPSVADLPEGPDAAFIAVSREKTVDVVAELAAMDAGGAVCFASGFAEVGEEGARLQEQLVAAMGELAIVGPNCYGLLNYLDGVTIWPDQHGGRVVDKGVGIVIQSGNIGISLTMQRRSLDIAYLISVGNMAGLAVHEYLEALLADERVTAIGLQVEAISDIPAFSQVALTALAQGVPIVALKSGTSERGRQLARSHTSALSGADQMIDVLFERIGVVRVRTLPQFVETLKFLSVIGPLPGKSIASISCSGGEATLVADLADRFGLTLAPLGKQQREDLQAVLGERVPLNNPLDYHTYIWGDEEAQYLCFSAMLRGSQDITLKVLDYPRADRSDDATWVKTSRAFGRAMRDQESRRDNGGRGAVVSTLQENLPPKVRKELLAQGIAPMQGLEECLLAVRSAAQLYDTRQRLPELRPLSAPSLEAGPVVALDEAQSKELLGRFGIPAPRSAVCSPEEAIQAAGEIGYPIALKVLSSEILHKSDVGGVALNLQSPEAVRQAARDLGSLGDRLLVETMAPMPVAELILGVVRDPQFGPALVLGAGGVLVELLQDPTTLLLPTSPAEVARALASLKIAPILDGYRGRPAADKAAIIEAVMGLARFAEEYSRQIVEVDINPLFALPEGQGVLAVDALIRMVRPGNQVLNKAPRHGQSEENPEHE